jgi:hypothetical protein
VIRPGAEQFTQSLKENTATETALAIGDGRVNTVIPHEDVWPSPRSDCAGTLHRHRQIATPPLLFDPSKRPVYAGDVGPGTWVVEVPARVVPVTVPLGAVAVLAGGLSPHAFVTPVHPTGFAQPGALRSIA